MRPESKILVVLLDGTQGGRSAWRSRGDSERFTVTRFGRLKEKALKSHGIDAVLYQVDETGESAARLREIKRLARGAPLLPFRLQSTQGRRPARGRARPRPEGEAPAIPITLPVDPALVEVLIDRERQLADLRQRVRRESLRSRDAEARMQAHAAIVRLTSNELDPQRIMDVAMERVREFLALRAWMFLMSDPEQGLLTVERTFGEGMGALKGRRYGMGEGVAGRAAQRRQPVLLDDAGTSAFGPADPSKPVPARSVVAVPLLSRGRLIGVVAAVDRVRAGHFTNHDARLLATLLEPAGVAIDNALLLRKSEELSITDDLTKLYNSRFLNSTLRREVERSKRYRTPVSLIFLDLDGFKNVNDQHGHLWGSRTLVEVGKVIAQTVREIDIVARFGGDEFTVILPQTGPEGAAIIAERIRQRIEETPFLASHGMDVRISASLGIASFPDHGQSRDDLLARADHAMYVVKGRGKNGVALAEAESPRPEIVESAR
ncbi:MAG TPA: sensor domain-containing diguanylate cyclase [Candidatus Polarisedimenticolia bacterium]|jgi:diguanylate cyclase (GGDEF)-like protein|nr:sensor domain-containing diguanylate cyclase [Candidatus Polarisedimenticolia bacterium]